MQGQSRGLGCLIPSFGYSLTIKYLKKQHKKSFFFFFFLMQIQGYIIFLALKKKKVKCNPDYDAL